MRNVKIENGKCYIDGKDIGRPFNQEELDEMWEAAMEIEAQRKAEWEALPEEEKKRLEGKYSDPFYERISDDPLGTED